MNHASDRGLGPHQDGELLSSASSEVGKDDSSRYADSPGVDVKRGDALAQLVCSLVLVALAPSDGHDRCCGSYHFPVSPSLVYDQFHYVN